MNTPYNMDGSRKQSSIHDTENIKSYDYSPVPLRLGIIVGVYMSDDPNNIPGITPGAQGYIVYDVKLTPEGVVIRNIPAMDGGGFIPNGLLVDPYFPPDISKNTNQNTDETPFLIGQPVIVGFFNNSPLNGIIIGKAPCQYNAGTQTTAEYPQKASYFQGTSEITDKVGNKTININVSGTTGTYKLQINSDTLCYINANGSTYTIELGDGNTPGNFQPTALGTTLQNFINSVFNSVTGHIHGPGSVPGGTGPPIGIVIPDIRTKIVSVQ